MQRNVCLPYLLQNVHVTSSDRQKKTMREPNKIWREGTREGNKEKSKNADTALQRVNMVIFIEQILRSHINRCKFNLVAR